MNIYRIEETEPAGVVPRITNVYYNYGYNTAIKFKINYEYEYPASDSRNGLIKKISYSCYEMVS